MESKTEQKKPDLTRILRDPECPNIKISDGEEVETLKEKWVEVECFNLDIANGTDPDDDLQYPFASLHGVVRGTVSKSIEVSYVLIHSNDGYFLYSLEGLEKAMNLVMKMRDKVTAAIKKNQYTPENA